MHGTRPLPRHPDYSHLLANGRANVAHIHAEATAAARDATAYRAANPTAFRTFLSYAELLRRNLRNEWSRAKLQREMHDALQAPFDATATALYGADMIDDTAERNATRAAIMQGAR